MLKIVKFESNLSTQLDANYDQLAIDYFNKWLEDNPEWDFKQLREEGGFIDSIIVYKKNKRT